MLINQIDVNLCGFFSSVDEVLFSPPGPVMKQVVIAEKVPDESPVEEAEVNPPEKPAESPVTNEQEIVPTDENEKKKEEGEEQEQTEEPAKKLHIELKDPSACKII